MANIIPPKSAKDILFKLSSHIEDFKKEIISESIISQLLDSHIDELHIKNIYVVDDKTAPDLLKSIDSKRIWSSPDKTHQVLGKCVPIKVKKSISNILFYNIAIYNRSKPLFYTIHHELGHAKDNYYRGDIKPFIYNETNHFFNPLNSYYIHIIKSEMAACYYSYYASSEDIIKSHLEIIGGIYSNRKNTLLAVNGFLVCDTIWIIIEEFCKIIANQIANPSLASISLDKPYEFPQALFEILVSMKSEIINHFESYSNYNKDFDNCLISNLIKLIEVMKFKFSTNEEGDFLINI